MNYSKIMTAGLSVSLLLGAAAPALASDGSDDMQVSATVSASTSVSTGEHDGKDSFPGSRFLSGLRDRLEKHAEADDNDSDHASSTEKKQDKIEKRMDKATEKGDQAIDKRIESLTELKARLANIKLLDATVLASINASLDAEIAKLVALKTQIDSATSTTTLKGDLGTITKGLRIFAVVEPKAHIAASASRINAVVTQITGLEAKLQTRVASAKAAGVDTAKAEAALTDMTAKLADAKAQADAAVSMTANLQADNGDATVRAANLKALKDARAKLVIAQQDLAAARHDVATVLGTVKGKGELSGEAHASTTESH